MSLIVAQDSNFGKEMWRWDHHQGETHPSDSTIRGMRPSSFQPYPAAMYKATQKNPWKFEHETAKDETAQRNLESRGFVAGGQGAAVEAFDKGMVDLATAAAHRNYEDRNISEKARAEVNAAEEASSTHLGEIQRQPVKRGRKPKVQ